MIDDVINDDIKIWNIKYKKLRHKVSWFSDHKSNDQKDEFIIS